MVVRDGGVGCGLTIDPEIIVFELVLINCAQSSLLRPCDGWCGVVWCGVVWCGGWWMVVCEGAEGLESGVMGWVEESTGLHVVNWSNGSRTREPLAPIRLLLQTCQGSLCEPRCGEVAFASHHRPRRTASTTHSASGYTRIYSSKSTKLMHPRVCTTRFDSCSREAPSTSQGAQPRGRNRARAGRTVTQYMQGNRSLHLGTRKLGSDPV